MTSTEQPRTTRATERCAAPRLTVRGLDHHAMHPAEGSGLQSTTASSTDGINAILEAPTAAARPSAL